MKPLALAALAATLLAAPALAQNAGQIAAVKRGGSCPGCDLLQIDLTRQEAKNRNFAGARVRQADMTGAILNGSNFSRTDARDLNAYGALFTGANFSGANLTNSSFVGAYLQGANFSGATLTGVNFSGAEMDRAVGLTQGQLSRACGDPSTRLPRNLSLPNCR